jgi:hypothetical protein
MKQRRACGIPKHASSDSGDSLGFPGLSLTIDRTTGSTQTPRARVVRRACATALSSATTFASWHG